MLNHYFYDPDAPPPPRKKRYRTPRETDIRRGISKHMLQKSWPKGTRKSEDGTSYTWRHPEDSSLTCESFVYDNGEDYTWGVQTNDDDPTFAHGKEIGPNRASDNAWSHMAACVEHAISRYDARPRQGLLGWQHRSRNKR